MGTFDNWINQRNSEFISIVKCIDELASKNDSTIKATISYLFENLLTAKLYIDSGLHLTLVNNTGLLGLETPNEILTAIFSDISPTFVNVCKSLPHGVSHKYAKYYIEKAALPDIEATKSSQPVNINNKLVKQLQTTLDTQAEKIEQLKNQLEQQVKDKQKTIDQQADQIEYLKNQLEQQTNQLSSAAEVDENSRTQDPKIIAMMAILLAGKQDIYKWGDKPNRSKIEAQIKNLIDTQLYIDSKHTHGLEAASKRIGKCLDDFSEYFYTLPKPNFEK